MTEKLKILTCLIKYNTSLFDNSIIGKKVRKYIITTCSTFLLQLPQNESLEYDTSVFEGKNVFWGFEVLKDIISTCSNHA